MDALNPIQHDEELELKLIDLDPLAHMLNVLSDGYCGNGCSAGGHCSKGCPPPAQT